MPEKETRRKERQLETWPAGEDREGQESRRENHCSS